MTTTSLFREKERRYGKNISRGGTPLLATIRSPRTLPLRSLSVRRSTIQCLSCSPLWFRSGRKCLPHHKGSRKLSGKSSAPSKHMFSKRKENGHDTPVHTHSCSWRRDCRLALYPALVRQSGPLLCPDHPRRRSGYLHRAPQAP